MMRDDEPTEEELERTIAEQMTCLPPWWPRPGERDIEDVEYQPPRRCKDCGRAKTIVGRGLCRTCYRRSRRHMFRAMGLTKSEARSRV